MGLRQRAKPTPEELIHEKYRGIRPAPGYPACPDHTEGAPIWKLLDVTANTGILITESFAMCQPEVSADPTSRIQSRATSHSARLDRDQAADYHQRKGMTIAEVER